jgi:hypothetical protein
VRYLVAQGYPAVNVDGGMQAWAAAGRPLVNNGDVFPEPEQELARLRGYSRRGGMAMRVR